MRNYVRLAAVSVFALSIAACGSPAEEEEAAPAQAEEAASDAAVAEESAVEAEDGEAAVAEESAEAVAEEEVAEEPAPEQAAAPAGPPAAFTQCQVCHQTAPGQNGIGPSLAGVFGRKAGEVSNFSYTEGMRSSGLTWDEATLDRYLAGPSAVVPGTTMAIGSLSDDERTAIIAYLKTL